MAEASSAVQVDTPADFGEGRDAVARRWIAEIEASEKAQAKWITRAKKIALIYREDRQDASRRRFSLLWANIQTLAPAVYARTPVAVVSRRFKDADPVGRAASEVLERGLNFAIETIDFADIMSGLRDDFLLVGRGQAWVRYVPHMAKAPKVANDDDADNVAPNGEITEDVSAYDKVEWEEVLVDHVHWQDFGTNPARNWQEVRFCWRRVYLTRDELMERFPDCGKDVPLDWGEKTDSTISRDEQFAKAAVYEIWDRPSRKAIWISKAYTSRPLDERADPLELKDFFPCPRPLLGTCGPDTTIPVPDYVYYQTQAEEINDLTARIDKLTDALKVRGWYAAAQKDAIDNLLSAGDNKMIPIDGWSALQDKGGIDKMIAWMPLEMVVAALKACIETRKQLLDDSYQITGIADIMRGDTDANETAAAQKLKSNWGSSRVRDRQKEMSRFARDVLRIMAEVIAKRFSPETLSKMTDVKLLTHAEKAQIQQVQALQQQQAALAAQAQAQPPQQPGAPQPPPVAPPVPIPPEVQRMMNAPSWEDVTALLQDNAQRTFRIEVETDSTIEPNDQEEKQRRVEFVVAVGKFLAESLPVVQAAPQMLPVIIEGLKFLVRGFRVGREMEDVIDQALEALQQAAAQPKPPQPADPADALKAQAAMTTAQATMFKAKADAQSAQIHAQAENMRSQADLTAAQHDQRMDVAGHQLAVHDQIHGQMMDAHQLATQTVEQAAQRELRREILDHSPAKVSTQ